VDFTLELGRVQAYFISPMTVPLVTRGRERKRAHQTWKRGRMYMLSSIQVVNPTAEEYPDKYRCRAQRASGNQTLLGQTLLWRLRLVWQAVLTVRQS